MKRWMWGLLLLICVAGAVAYAAPSPQDVADAAKAVGNVAHAIAKQSETSEPTAIIDHAVMAALIAILYAVVRGAEYIINIYRARRSVKSDDAVFHLSGEDLAKLQEILSIVRESYEIKVKVLDKVTEIKSFADSHKGNCDKCAQRMERLLMDADKLMDMHEKTDEYGVPVWYVPRAWVENLKDILQALAKSAETQRATLQILENIASRMGRLEAKQ